MEAVRLDGGAVVTTPTAEDAVDRSRGRRRLVRHPAAITLLAIALGGVAFSSYSSVSDGLIAAGMIVVLVVLAAIDVDRRIIPNRIVLPATAIVLVARVATLPARTPEFLVATVGAAVALLLPNLINSKAMGMGDVKLAAFLGAGLGWGVIGATAVAFISIFPFAVGTLVRDGLAARKSSLPFGPFLALGALVILIVPRLLGLGGS